MRDAVLFLAVFAACTVEAVEALTVVLAVGLTRGWAATMRGVGCGLAVLALIIGLLGPTLTAVPIGDLRILVGGLLLIFGLGWLRKAILRAGGLKALHDEDAIYARNLAAAQGAQSARTGLLVDSYAFTLAFKAVVLEGLEVAFIVVTFGANQHNTGLAAVAAVAAVVTVAAAGMALRAPLSRVPENSMKFGVGVLLTSFGMFWSVEGTGAHWPGGDAALIGLVALTAALSLAAVSWLRSTATRPPTGTVEAVA